MKLKYVIRKRQIGDVLWIEPVIRQLAQKNRKLIVHSKYNSLFANYPYPNVVFKEKLSFLEKLTARIEKVIRTRVLFINLDMSYETRPRMHFLHAYQAEAGLPFTNEYPKLYLNKKEEELSLAGNDKYVVIHIESFSERNYRRVYGIDWPVITSYLQSLGFKIIQVGKAPLPMPGTHILQTDLRELISVINKCAFFIGLDSGPGNIAASLQKPSLLFFGAVNPAYRHFPELFKGYFLQQYCEFAGCYHDIVQTAGPICKLVGDSGIPKCSMHSNEYVLSYIDKLLETYKIC